MAAQSNPLKDLGNALVKKAIDTLPGVLGYSQQPAGSNNLPVATTKGETAAKEETKPAVPWYLQPTTWIVAAGVGVLIYLTSRR